MWFADTEAGSYLFRAAGDTREQALEALREAVNQYREQMGRPIIRKRDFESECAIWVENLEAGQAYRNSDFVEVNHG
jgi:molybdopterin synthase catalytic subunit